MNNNQSHQYSGKRWIVLLVTLVMMLVWTLPIGGMAQNESPYPFVANVNAEKVNMRRRPSSTSTVLERIEKDTPVTVLGDTGSYYKISYNERTGYVMKDYIGSGNPIENDGTTVSDYPYITSTNASVKLRSRPSSSAVVLAYIGKGDTVTIKSRDDRFAEAEYNGINGYIMIEYLNLLLVEDEAEQRNAILEEEAQNIYLSLERGSEGAEVRALQSALIELGFLQEGEIDGVFGGSTKKAVEAFQKKNDLKVTGIADKGLQSLIYENKPRSSKGKMLKVKTLAPAANVVMRLNNVGDAVEELQMRLLDLLYEPGEINGVYHKETMAAIKQFQKKNDLKVDGLAGAETRELLYSMQALPATAKPAPSPAPLPSPPKNPVKKGDTGDDSALVQERLADLGYYQGMIDGIFGSSSVTALQQFQQQNYLQADGVAGKETLVLLFSHDAISTQPPEVTAEPITMENAVTIKSGVSGEAVRRLQKRLTELGYYSSRNDGEYFADDIAAVRAFQRNSGLEVDGVAGYNTQVLLYSENAKMAWSEAVVTTSPDGSIYQTLRQNDTGDQVMALQNRLIELGYLAQGEADGRYGLKTAEAVVLFQRAHGLLRDGIAGSKTQEQLYASTASAKDIPQETADPEYLTQGDSSDAVKSMQEKLIQLGYLSGRADGIFGIETSLALRSFQLRNGLSVDGIAGSRTLGTLHGGNATPAESLVKPTPAIPSMPDMGGNINTFFTPKAAQVNYSNWYSGLRNKLRENPIVTLYDFSSGISWQINVFSNGAHADGEPLTAQDTANMLKAFGGKQTWTPKAVWAVLMDGSVYMASTHSVGHDVDHTPGNNLSGHVCIHFPRSASQVTAIGPYATSHQAVIDAGWGATQNMIR
ncbi:MAG: SH3 domain-containing protein [Clostridiales bacterium]|nr:SH3 domain-containing protein [Clostridiales bacterium]